MFDKNSSLIIIIISTIIICFVLGVLTDTADNRFNLGMSVMQVD